MPFLLILLVVASALGQPLQIAANSRLREAVQSPALSSLIAFVVGSVLLAILVVSGLFERGRLSGAHQSPLVGLDGRRAGRLLHPGRHRRPSAGVVIGARGPCGASGDGLCLEAHKKPKSSQEATNTNTCSRN